MESALAALTGACAAQAAAWTAPAGFREWCSAASGAHSAHVTVLLQADPLGGVTTNRTPVEAMASASPAAGSLGEALQAVASQYQATAASHRKTALTQTDPAMAMMWVSLDCFAGFGAHLFAAHPDGASLGTPVAQGSAVPARIAVGSRTEALQVLLSRIDELSFGLTSMIGRSGNNEPQMSARFTEVQGLRNAVSVQITAASASPTAPAVDYTLPGNVNDPNDWSRLWGQLEAGVLAGWAPVAASSAGADRSSAMDSMVAQSPQPVTRGVPLSWWPGWL